MVGLALVLTAQRPHLSGANNVSVAGPVASLRRGQRLCQGGETIPPRTRAVRLFTGTDAPGAGPLRLTLLRADRTRAATGGVPLARGFVTVPVTPLTQELTNATVCVSALGARPLVLGGALGILDPTVTVAGRRQHGRLRIDYFRPGAESWLALLPTIARRAGYGRASWFGSWTLWVVAAMLFAIWAGGLAVVLRSTPAAR